MEVVVKIIQRAKRRHMPKKRTMLRLQPKTIRLTAGQSLRTHERVSD